MRIAVVGCGSIGRRHIANLLALGCEVRAMDPSEDARLNARAASPAAQIHDTLSFTGLDALVIATPYDKHLAWVEEAIRRNLPFFVEKPLGSLEQLPRWREIAKRWLPINQVGYMLRFHEQARAMRQKYANPTEGLFLCECDSREWPGRSYGPMLLEASHEIDLALWMGAEPLVCSVEGADDWRDICFAGSWKVHLDWRASRYCRRWTVSDCVKYTLALFQSPDELGDQMYRDEMAHFLKCVREQTPTLCPLSDGLKVLEVCAAVEAMSRATA